MNSGKIVAGGRVDGTEIEGFIRGPRGHKKNRKKTTLLRDIEYSLHVQFCHQFQFWIFATLETHLEENVHRKMRCGNSSELASWQKLTL